MSKADLFKKQAQEDKEKRIAEKTKTEIVEQTEKPPIEVIRPEETQEKKQITMTFSLDEELRDDFKLYTDVHSLNRSELIRNFINEYLSDKRAIIETLRKVK